MGVEPIGCELADRLEHRHAGLPAGDVDETDEALLGQRRQPGEDIEDDVVGSFGMGGNRFDCLDLGIGEDGQQLEQALLCWVEQVIAPVHRGPQGLLSLGQVARPAAQQCQPVLESIAEHLRGEQPHVRRGELDRQGQPIEPSADLGHGRGVLVGQLEVGADDLARSTKSWTASKVAI